MTTPPEGRPVPTATYRLQLTPTFGFDEAREIVPYLHRLGISHLYLSPVMEAVEGSEHGYDVVDPTRVRAALGGEDGLRALAEAGLPIVLDIVPNHMAACEANPWWADPGLRERFFDIDPATGRHRRFFLVDDLAGVRQEDDDVFRTTHAKVLELVRDGLVSGLRVDHVDGLADPAGYLRRLAAEAGEGVPVWVEKILHPGERLRPWATAGTTGYDFLADLDATIVDPTAEEPLTALYGELAGERRTFAELSLEARFAQATGGFAPEVDRLRRLLDVPGIAEALASLPTYRTFVEPWSGLVPPEDRALLDTVDLDPELRRVLLLDAPAPPEFVTRFQQTSPGVMAKGVEDTAFYRYHRLLALNEVGNDPGRFCIGVDEFHRAAVERWEHQPYALLAATTHDTKRTADVRARLLALTHVMDRFEPLMREWFAVTDDLAGDLDPNVRWFVLQTLLGAGFLAPVRLQAYLHKAMREAAVHTTWAEPDEDWERELDRFVARLRRDDRFLRSFTPFADAIDRRGRRLSVAMTLLRATSPGIPDTYQGDEVPYRALVDPDNRRPVDWARRQDALSRSVRDDPVGPGDAKLHVLHRALVERRRDPSPFEGSYAPLDAGPATVAFVRGDAELAVVAPLRPDAAAEVDLPAGTWSDVLGPGQVAGGRHRVADLTGSHGVAFLRRSGSHPL